ncbi:MAG: GldG family protein [Gammaproteobacteria bacterium]|nr:GldG family protein [Gammaproteobacteria bacterium]MCP5136724.1 GldG family protein [Gammaproteobacteria bacterium]
MRSQRLANLAFTVLFVLAVVLAGWLSSRHSHQFDWTSGARNTLSEASTAILAQLNAPLEIVAFAREDELVRARVQRMVDRYLRGSAHIGLRFVNPDTAPEQVREQGITVDGELLIRYAGRSEKVADLSEQSISNALLRLSRGGERRVLFLSGHGERAPEGEANFDWRDFSAAMAKRGLTAAALNLAVANSVPDNAAVLVVADPRTDLLAGERQALADWIAKGGSLLWLAEPRRPLPEDMAALLGVQTQPGTVVDANTSALGIRDPSFALVAEYDAANPVTRDFKVLTVYPQAAPVDRIDGAVSDWQVQPLLQTLPRSWAETGPLRDKIGYDADTERAGPLPIGLTLTRRIGDREQRVAVIGDADFLANSYLGNAGNLDLGLALFNWLAHDDRLVAIPAKTAPDVDMAFTPALSAVIGFGVLLGLPLSLLAVGAWVWWRRRRR